MKTRFQLHVSGDLQLRRIPIFAVLGTTLKEAVFRSSPWTNAHAPKIREKPARGEFPTHHNPLGACDTFSDFHYPGREGTTFIFLVLSLWLEKRKLPRRHRLDRSRNHARFARALAQWDEVAFRKTVRALSLPSPCVCTVHRQTWGDFQRTRFAAAGVTSCTHCRISGTRSSFFPMELKKWGVRLCCFQRRRACLTR